MDVKGRVPEAGWYPDPTQNGVRFWNGSDWTPLRRDVGVLEAGPGGSLVVHGVADPDYSYRAVARLSRRSQESHLDRLVSAAAPIASGASKTA